jgi:hypothetical protein
MTPEEFDAAVAEFKQAVIAQVVRYIEHNREAIKGAAIAAGEEEGAVVVPNTRDNDNA